MAKGYSTATAVAQYLAQLLDVEQTAQVNSLIAAAEAMIDRETRRSWLASPITAERYDIAGPQIFLRQRPVVSIQTVHVRTAQVGDPGRDLTADTEYELLDANLGQLRFANISGDQANTPGPDDIAAAILGRDEAVFTNAIAFVSYTPVGPALPADIGLAATMIVAETLYPTLFPDRRGINRAQLDNQTSIVYTTDGLSLTVPVLAQRIIEGNRLAIFA